MAVIVGTPNNDLIDRTHTTPGNDLPTDGPDSINGHVGDDQIHGLGGGDLLLGAENQDDLFGDEGDDTINGGDSSDVIRGGIGSDKLDGESGNDNIDGEAGNDSIDGGFNGDVLTGGLDKDSIFGGIGNDILVIAAADELVSGELYNGGLDIDRLAITTQELVDLSKVFLSNIEEIVGDGKVNAKAEQLNRITYLQTGELTLTTSGTVDLRGDEVLTTLFNLHSAPRNTFNLTGCSNRSYTVNGGAFNDTVFGGTQGDLLQGFARHDHLEGLGGNDTLIGGVGNDGMDGGADNDIAVFSDIAKHYDVVLSGAARYDVTHLNGGSDGEDIVLRVETLQFADGFADVEWAARSNGEILSPARIPQIGNALTPAVPDFGKLLNLSYVGAFSASQILNKGIDLAPTKRGDPPAIGECILLTSGDGAPAFSNDESDHTVKLGTKGDADLDKIIRDATGLDIFKSLDAAVVTFTLKVTDAATRFIGFDVIYGSEEYPSTSNPDVAGVIVNGVNYAKFENDPLRSLGVLDRMLPIFIDNSGDSLDIEYNGVTPLLSVVAPVHLGSNTIKIAIGDSGTFDSSYDSALFIGNMLGFSTGSGGLYLQQTGTLASDTMLGTDDPDEFRLNSGNDAALAFGGNDLMRGDAGDDSLEGGDGDDTADGGSGNDVLEGAAGKDVLIGGAGFDTASYIDAVEAVTINLALHTAAGGHAAGDKFFSIEGVIGSDAADKLTGDAGINTFVGGPGADTIDGGGGLDTADYSARGAVSINLTTKNFQLAAAGDVLTGIERIVGSTTGDDFIAGANDKDFLEGLGGKDILDGVGGSDQLNGGGSSDRLVGRVGADTLIGAGGNDGLNGGVGNDKMAGGDGADTFTYDIAGFGADQIADFEDNIDKLWFKKAVADAFADFTITGNGTVSVHLAVIGNAGQSIDLHSNKAITLTASDFLFFA